MNDLHSFNFPVYANPSTLTRFRRLCIFAETSLHLLVISFHFFSYLFDDHLFIYLFNLVHHKSQKQTINKQSSPSKFNLRKLQRFRRGGRCFLLSDNS
ncbi:hypothetical protein AB3S75_025523 [Citrus x aurantiifolia]